MDDTTKKILIGVLIAIVSIPVLYGVYMLVSKGSEPAKPIDLKITASDWVRGNKNAKNTLVEYGDLQCPACKAYEPYIDAAMKKYKDKLKLVFRHYPLSIHQNSHNAAYAAEAAGVQNKFWEMHDLLYAKQEEWSDLQDPTNKFISYAKSLGMDTDKFKTSLTDPKIKDRVNQQIQSGNEINIQATPTFYLNGAFLDGQDLQNMDSKLN